MSVSALGQPDYFTVPWGISMEVPLLVPPWGFPFLDFHHSHWYWSSQKKLRHHSDWGLQNFLFFELWEVTHLANYRY